MIRQFEAGVRRIRAMGGEELRSGNYTLEGLGFINAVYFQGVNARNPDGTLRLPVTTPAHLSRSTPPARRTSSNGGRDGAASASSAEPPRPNRPPRDRSGEARSSGKSPAGAQAQGGAGGSHERQQAGAGASAEPEPWVDPSRGMAPIGDMLKRRRRGAAGWESPPQESLFELYDSDEGGGSPPRSPLAEGGEPGARPPKPPTPEPTASLVEHFDAGLGLPRFLPPISVRVQLAHVGGRGPFYPGQARSTPTLTLKP